MEQANEITAMSMRATRSGVSRKLLTRKAKEAAGALPGEPLEASFPSASDAPSVPDEQPLCGSPIELTIAIAEQPPLPAAWSNEDETNFQLLFSRRMAAGYQRRGRDLSGQVLQPGTIQPNAETIVATIVALVAERGQVSRGELLRLMATTHFPHPKAQPNNKGWCQGYVAGALRNGFLAVAVSNEPSPATSEGS